MTLLGYMEKTGRTPTELAARFEVSPQYVSMMAAGKRAPSRQLAVRIERQTGGAVPVEVWGEVA